MEIGPISGIRPLTQVRPVQRQPDLAGVFAVELREQAREEGGTASRRASRGLEDEDTDDIVADEEDHGEPGVQPVRSTINFFA